MSFGKNFYDDFDIEDSLQAYLVFQGMRGFGMQYPLSTEQVKMIHYILGLKQEADGSITSYSDEGLKEIMEAIKRNVKIVTR